MGKNGEVVLTAEDGSEETFFVMEKAEIAGREYLLVTNEPVGGGDIPGGTEALILRASGDNTDGETLVYDVVEDEDEQRILSKYFEELLDDIDFSM